MFHMLQLSCVSSCSICTFMLLKLCAYVQVKFKKTLRKVRKRLSFDGLMVLLETVQTSWCKNSILGCCPNISSVVSSYVATKTAEKCPDLSLKISGLLITKLKFSP